MKQDKSPKSNHFHASESKFLAIDYIFHVVLNMLFPIMANAHLIVHEQGY